VTREVECSRSEAGSSPIVRTARGADDRARICEALRRAEGDKSLAAVILGWSRMTLYRKMRRLGIDYGTGKATESQPV
jgi:transcriptional regulator of acetoin/glycerol metabolism